MNRSVYIGGFGNGYKLAENVGEALIDTGNYEDVDYITFSQAMKDPELVRRAVKGVDVHVHSAGLLALKDTAPKKITGIATPLPTSPTRLVAKTGIKSAKMLGHSLTSMDAFQTVNGYNASSIAELASHPVGNLKYLRQIAKTDSIQLAGLAQDAGIFTQLYFMDRDDFGFIPNDEQRTFASTLGVELHMIEGRHDQLPLYPAETLGQIA